MLESLQSTLRSWVNVSVVVGALGFPALASALGLGEITLHSALNQPLRADIALVDVAGIGEGDLSASLASPDDFSRAGVERVFFLNDLRFTPVLRGDRSFIRVTSNKPVEEPFLNFLVQLNQPNGRLLREYTVLIDPPGTPGIVPVRDEPSAAPQSIKPPPAVQGKRYTVVQGDNPWIIAKRLHDAGSNASVNELMQGIQALNPGSDRLSIGSGRPVIGSSSACCCRRLLQPLPARPPPRPMNNWPPACCKISSNRRPSRSCRRGSRPRTSKSLASASRSVNCRPGWLR